MINIDEVCIPLTYALVFNYNSTIHGGGSSRTNNTQFFSIVGDVKIRQGLEESNSSRGISNIRLNAEVSQLITLFNP